MKKSDARAVMVDPNAMNAFATGIDYANTLMGSDTVRQMSATEFWDAGYSWLRPYSVSGGVLTIPVQGSLIHGFPYQYGAWATGYEYIKEAVKRGLADDEVEVIAFHINSPGGHVSGNFDLVDYIYEARGQKKTVALVNERACSAAYHIASAAEYINVPKTGGVGSVGVVMTHMDFSAAMAQIGIKTTFVYAGKHKVDGNSIEPLPDSVKERWQAEVESFYSDFVASVARNRGLEETAVRDTEAGIFMAAEALGLGLVDTIAPHPDSSVALATLFKTEETDQMANEKPQITTEAHEVAVADSRNVGMKEGASAERVRITTILNSEAAKDRPKAALAAALKTDMDAEAAQVFLADLPKEKAENEKPGTAGVGRDNFNQAMNSTPNPELGAGDDAAPQDKKSEDRVAGTLALIGVKKEQK